MASRALAISIGLGVLLGGALAFVPLRKRTVPRPEPTLARAPEAHAPPAQKERSLAAPASSVAPEPPPSSSPPTRRTRYDLMPSPHDSPIETEAELRKSERLCIRDVADECVRVADAYTRAKLVEPDKHRARQYQNLAFRAYIQRCEGQKPAACYALARMYLYGDTVKANPAQAQNLMKRVVDLCRYRPDDICSRLTDEAPVPPKHLDRQR